MEQGYMRIQARSDGEREPENWKDFREWLKTRRARDNPRGDFLRDWMDRLREGHTEDVGPAGEDRLPDTACQEAHDELAALRREWEEQVFARMRREHEKKRLAALKRLLEGEQERKAEWERKRAERKAEVEHAEG